MCHILDRLGICAPDKTVNYSLMSYTVVTNIQRNDCRLLHRSISISKKERSGKLFRFNLVTTVNNMYIYVYIQPNKTLNYSLVSNNYIYICIYI